MVPRVRSWVTLTAMSGASPVIGRRVIVTGLAGSGKSTLSIALAKKTGLPLIHLDLEYWKPGWVDPSLDEWRQKQREVLAGDAWIADGNYHETLELRLERADTVLFLDVPWWRCSARALVRGFEKWGDLPPGCEFTRWRRLRDEWKLAFRIWRENREQPEIERQIIATHGQHVAMHVFRTAREANGFLAGITPAATAGR